MSVEFEENDKSACECFGFDETTTEKWAVKLMRIWYNVMTAIWVVWGMLTFAPILFVSKKISIVFKHTWIAVTISIVLYYVVVLSPIWIKLIIQTIK